MPLNSLLLQNVHENVHVFSMKLNYSEPKIYTGGVDISTWSKLTAKQKNNALERPWYLYFSFRDPSSGKLVRQPNIKAGANRFKTKTERYAYLRKLQQSLIQLLQFGFNPYEDNTDLENQFLSGEKTQSKKEPQIKNQVKEKDLKKENIKPKEVQEIPEKTIEEALDFALDIKVSMMNKNSFVQYSSRIGLFKKWLKSKEYLNKPLSFITRRIITEYLNEVLKRTSPRNRNNSRTDLASTFQLLEDNEWITVNFVKRIPKLKSVPKRNKTYSPKQEDEIFKYLEKNDPYMILFIRFVSYSFLRPIEICRLKVEDIDVENKLMYIKSKTKPVQKKIIPQILLDHLPDLSQKDPRANLFGRYEIGEVWDAEPINKRNEFSKRFKAVKDHFKLGSDYGIYSFKHTYVTKLYVKYVKTMTPQQAKSKLMNITGHVTLDALQKYLRDIDAEMPADYSEDFA
ncbi:Phage integrase family protein [Polaribacter dokdonensis DSW-5]|uniref:Phage integrase family protein n=2 Tax=Polaribacter TaxID=52959 RepID=A0A0M9CGG7_9FLAO|nr:tyrosine-type recombinase/integrase [Polaribacter dokdonensis]KOY51926.1 Phage integrase family protein [Polaribacter dokdonensis DSW-5]SED99682.1 Phage integrase family protein [Polaribacter dokdonensis DSW-5]